MTRSRRGAPRAAPRASAPGPRAHELLLHCLELLPTLVYFPHRVVLCLVEAHRLIEALRLRSVLAPHGIGDVLFPIAAQATPDRGLGLTLTETPQRSRRERSS